jgi:hypothetical protein
MKARMLMTVEQPRAMRVMTASSMDAAPDVASCRLRGACCFQGAPTALAGPPGPGTESRTGICGMAGRCVRAGRAALHLAGAPPPQNSKSCATTDAMPGCPLVDPARAVTTSLPPTRGTVAGFPWSGGTGYTAARASPTQDCDISFAGSPPPPP